MISRAIIIAILFLGASPLAAIPVTIYLVDGRTLSVDYDRAGQEGVTWRLNPGDPNTQLTPLTQISRIDFPPPSAWEEAQEILATGDLETAFEKFATIAKNQFNHGYPVPGNYASLALVELLDIRRRQLDPAMIAEQARILTRESATLPADRRTIEPVVEAWIALSKEDYETALKSLGTIENGNSEIAYVRGRALEGVGEIESAVEAYAETYTLGIGDRSEMSRDALRRSITILDALDREERFPEVHAQIKLYAELYGSGKLWPGAPEHLIKTAAAKLDTITGMIDKPIVAEVEAPDPPAPAKAAPAKPATPGAVAANSNPDGPPHDLTRLPGPADREYVLTQEVENPAYFIGRPALVNEGATRDELGWHFDGSGAKLVAAEKINCDGKAFRLRCNFTSLKPDGVIVDGRFQQGGFALYLEKGILYFEWTHTRTAKTRDISPLGKVNLGEMTFALVTVTEKKALRARFLDAPADKAKTKVRSLLALKNSLSFAVGDRASEGFPPNNELPAFTGTIHLLSVGAEKEAKDIGPMEMEMFDGKKLQINPPPLPEIPPLVPSIN